MMVGKKWIKSVWIMGLFCYLCGVEVRIGLRELRLAIFKC